MKHSFSHLKFVFVLTLVLGFSVAVNAQRGRHYDNRNYDRYRTWHYSPVRIHTYNTYHYKPNYFYRPYYRPHYYRPIFRLPHYVHFGPSFGFHLSILPFGYSTIYIGPTRYYYNEGIYYSPLPRGGYEVIAPPLGAEVSHLPIGATLRIIDEQRYYELGGTFYEEIYNGNKTRYRVVGVNGVLNTNDENDVMDNNQADNYNNAPAVGSRVDQLPAGSKTVVINNEKLYLSADGSYYKEVIENNKVRYEIVGNQAN